MGASRRGGDESPLIRMNEMYNKSSRTAGLHKKRGNESIRVQMPQVDRQQDSIHDTSVSRSRLLNTSPSPQPTHAIKQESLFSKDQESTAIGNKMMVSRFDDGSVLSSRQSKQFKSLSPMNLEGSRLEIAAQMLKGANYMILGEKKQIEQKN